MDENNRICGKDSIPLKITLKNIKAHKKHQNA